MREVAGSRLPGSGVPRPEPATAGGDGQGGDRNGRRPDRSPSLHRYLRLLTFSGSHPLIAEGHLLSAEDIATTVLDGVRARSTGSPTTGGPQC